MEKGFTIIEIIISIFILSIAIIGIFSAFSVVVILTSDSADRLAATYLAQEGMEAVRNIRDTNWLNVGTCASSPCSYTWVDGLTGDGVAPNMDCSSNAGGCEVDFTSTAPGVAHYAARYLMQDAKGFYDYDSTGNAVPTKFKRKITITPLTDVDNDSTNTHVIMVKSQVSWDQKATILDSGHQADPGACNSANCITVEEAMYNWY